MLKKVTFVACKLYLSDSGPKNIVVLHSSEISKQ